MCFIMFQLHCVFSLGCVGLEGLAGLSVGLIDWALFELLAFKLVFVQ